MKLASSVTLAKGDDSDGPRFAGALPDIKLAFRLETWPTVCRARGAPERGTKAIGHCEMLRRRLFSRGRVPGGFVRCRSKGYGGGDDACNEHGGGHPDDRSEHCVPLYPRTHGRTTRARVERSAAGKVKPNTALRSKNNSAFEISIYRRKCCEIRMELSSTP